MFILFEDWSLGPDGNPDDDIAAMMDAHRRYFAYVEENRASFPSGAYELASAEWRHDFSDPRALHDSWIESFRFLDRSLPEGGDTRDNDLELVLLGAYHDGHIRLIYKKVYSARLSLDGAQLGPVEIYGDEIRLSSAGRVLHEIEFLAGENWLIECENMEQHWVPFASATDQGNQIP